MIARELDNANTGATVAAEAPTTVGIAAPDRARLCDATALVRDVQGNVRLSDTCRAGGEGATLLLFPHLPRNDARRLTLRMMRLGRRSMSLSLSARVPRNLQPQPMRWVAIHEVLAEPFHLPYLPNLHSISRHLLTYPYRHARLHSQPMNCVRNS